MDKLDREQDEVVEEGTEVMEGDIEDFWVIELKKPIKFERKTHDKIDLKRIHEITAGDMIEINRRMAQNGAIYQTPELTLEYALNMANIVTNLPLEFFDKLPPYAAMAVRGRVINFLFTPV